MQLGPVWWDRKTMGWRSDRAWTGKQAQSGSQRGPRYLSPQAAHLEKGERSPLLAGLGKPVPLNSPQAPTPPHPRWGRGRD